MFDVIVVGSGPAGTCAAYALRGRNVLMLDVGFQPDVPDRLQGNIFKLRRETPDLFLPLIGENFESLHNLHRKKISLRLKSPYLSYITRDWENLTPVSCDHFEGALSFARGGLANAWGAGVYRFNNRDLASFPITAEDLAPYYDLLTSHIGISGQNDDLEPYFGHDDRLQEPMKTTPFASGLLSRYLRKKGYFNGQGVFIGLPRLAVLTRDHNNRRAYAYEHAEFFRPSPSAIYNPSYTLEEMIRKKQISYQDGYFVSRYRELEEQVEVAARHVRSGRVETFRARKLVLAAGALNTAKIVLTSCEDHETALPFLDNPMAVFLLLSARGIGAPLEMYGSSLTQLNIVYDGPLSEDVLQASLYGTNGPLRTDVLFELPLPLSVTMALSKYNSQCTGAVMLFYPGRQKPGNYVKLNRDASIELHCEDEPPGAVEQLLMRSFRKMGYFSAPFLCQHPKMGNGLHFAGMLPMKDRPARYQTDRSGRLFGTRHVFIADGACFSSLPSKNLTFTIMANAMRIADSLKGGVSGP